MSSFQLKTFDPRTKAFLELHKKKSVVFQILLKAEELDIDIFFIRMRKNSNRIYYVNKRTATNIGKNHPAFPKMTESKLGRLVNRINKKLPKPRNIGPTSIEKAADMILMFRLEYTHEITTDIKEIYDQTKSVYSCMAKKNAIKDLTFYEQNGVKAFIIRDKKGRIRFRSLIWENVEVRHPLDRKEAREKPFYLDVYDNFYYNRSAWRMIGLEVLGNFSENLVGANDLIGQGHQLIYKLKQPKIYAKYPYLDTFKYISYDYKYISTQYDEKFLERQLPDVNEFVSADNIGNPADRIMATCPSCQEIVFEGMLFYNIMEDKVKGCTKCTYRTNDMEYFKIDEMTVFEKANILKNERIPNLQIEGRWRKLGNKRPKTKKNSKTSMN